MRSSRSDRIKFHTQVFLIRVMYYQYWTYWTVLASLYLYFPIYCAFLLVFRKLKNFTEYGVKLDYYILRVMESITFNTYKRNLTRLNHDIEEKRKEL